MVEFQYYYKKSGCPAKTSYDADCICWNDEGTGLFKDERHNEDVRLVEWRVKPLDKSEKTMNDQH